MKNNSKVAERRKALEVDILIYLPHHVKEAIVGLNRYFTIFNNFYWDDFQKEMASQKLIHTMDMTRKMLLLSREMPEEWRIVYYWTGLLHDIGRLTDICHSSYKCSKHNEQGTELLYDIGLINMFVEDKRIQKAIKNAILLHGVNSIEEKIAKDEILLNEFEFKLCQDTRTADKWDIMEFLLKEPTKVIVGASEEEIAKMSVTETTLQEFVECRPVNKDNSVEEYTDMRHFLSHVGFIFDITETRLFKWLEEENWVDRYLDKLQKPKDAENLEKIRKIAKDYISQQLIKA